MKTKLFILLFFLTYQTTFGQVTNDSCLSAIDLGTVYGINANYCMDGTTIGYDTAVFSSNVNSLPNIPYFSMTSCQGYINSTSSFANDIWYKLKTNGFNIKVIGFPTIGGGLDTIHLNVWHGTNCNLVQTGCYTFDMVTPSNFTVPYSGDTVGGQNTYLQFSGNSLGKVGTFGFCIAGINGGSGIIENKYSNQFTIYPNPAFVETSLQIENYLNNATVYIYNSIGQQVKKINNIYGQTIKLQRDNLPSGIYLIRLTQDNMIYSTNKLIIVDK